MTTPNPAAPRRRPLRVAEILEATVGGTRRQAELLLEHLGERGFQFTYFYSAERDPKYRERIPALQAQGVECVEVPMKREPNLLGDLVALYRLARSLRRGNFDAVHAHSSKAGLLGRAAAWLAGVPRVYYSPHVYYFHSCSGLARWAYAAIEWASGVLTTKTVVLSQGQFRRTVRSGAARPRKMAVIENGVDLEHFGRVPPKAAARRALGLAPNRPVVAMVARLSARKGADVFARVAAEIHRRRPDVQFALAGEGDLRPVVEQMRLLLGLEACLHLLGYVEDPRKVYGAADVCVLTSRHEGLPYALLEAMAAGVAQVATDVPGNADAILDGANGFLVPFGQVKAFADKVCLLLDDAALRAKMGRAGREMAEGRFCLERFLARFAALLRCES